MKNYTHTYVYNCIFVRHHKRDSIMKKISRKKIIAFGKTLGVNLKFDKSLDKYSKILPPKMEETDKLLANSTFDF